VYVLRYKIDVGRETETRTNHYTFNERQNFMDEYIRINDKYYIHDIETFYADLKDVDMNEVLGAI